MWLTYDDLLPGDAVLWIHDGRYMSWNGNDRQPQLVIAVDHKRKGYVSIMYDNDLTGYILYDSGRQIDPKYWAVIR